MANLATLVGRKRLHQKIEPTDDLGTCELGDAPHTEGRTCVNWKPEVERLTRLDWIRVFGAFFVLAVVAYLIFVVAYVTFTGGQ